MTRRTIPVRSGSTTTPISTARPWCGPAGCPLPKTGNCWTTSKIGKCGFWSPIASRPGWRRTDRRLKGIAGTAASCRIADQNAAPDKTQDVAERGILRAFGEFGPFRGSEVALEAVKQTVEYKTLPLVDRGGCNGFPEARFGKHGGERGLSAFNGAAEAAQEPVHPRRNVHRPVLCPLQNFVISVVFPPDLRRHAVEALRTVFGARQGHIGN